MNASTGLAAQARSAGGGRIGRRIGWGGHQAPPPPFGGFPFAGCKAPPSHGAPSSTQRRKRATQSGASGSLGGIFLSAIILISRLPTALPGTTAGPDAPPSSIFSRVDRSRSPFGVAPA